MKKTTIRKKTPEKQGDKEKGKFNWAVKGL